MYILTCWVKLVRFTCQDLLFGTCLNGAMLTALKKNPGRPNPLELCDIETFALRLTDAIRSKDTELAEQRAIAEVKPDDVSDSEVVKLEKGLVKPEPNKYAKGTEEHFTATAAQLLNIYCSLQPEPDTEAGSFSILSQRVAFFCLCVLGVS